MNKMHMLVATRGHGLLPITTYKKVLMIERAT